MNKDFFDSYEQRKTAFTSRLEDPENVRGELILTTGRTYVIEKVVEATDAWVQIDGRDSTDEDMLLSVILPYHQVGHVSFVKRKHKVRGTTGFAR